MSTPGKDAPLARILVVEDSSVFREMQQLLLGQAGYAVSAHESPQTALEIAEKQHFDLVVIDYELPQMNGEQFMHALRKLQPEIAVIFVSGSLTLELAIKLTSQGVAGVFNKPANPKTLLEKVNETLARNSAPDTVARVGSRDPLAPPGRAKPVRIPLSGTEPAADRPAYLPRFFPGDSPGFRDFTHRAWKVRDFRSVLLLQGEPGSPFELLARELVEISIFRDGPVMVCPAGGFEPRRIIEILAPALLSHDAGTLIVTGVESFSDQQQKTLQNLISGRDVFLPFARRFRVVLATTGRLSDRVDAGTFNETLFYKISSLSLSVPSLREMRSDIPAIARHVLTATPAGGNAAAPPILAPEALAWLEAREWPENYDELSRTVLAAVPFSDGGMISVASLASVAPQRTAAPSDPEVAAAPSQIEIPARPGDVARPPFPISSDLAAETATASPVPPAVASDSKDAGDRITPSTRAADTRAKTAAVAAAPAGRLFAKPVPEPARTLAAKSLFRPASASYEFTKRLEECLATADAGGAD